MKLTQINPKSLSLADDKEVLSLHRRVHQLLGRRPEPEKKKELERLHSLIVDEMLKRGFEHEGRSPRPAMSSSSRSLRGSSSRSLRGGTNGSRRGGSSLSPRGRVFKETDVQHSSHDGAVRPAHDGDVRPSHEGAVRPSHEGAVRPAHDGDDLAMRQTTSSEPVSEREEKLLERLSSLPERFVIIPEALCITGSTLYAKDREPNDCDVILRADVDGSGSFVFPIGTGGFEKIRRMLSDVLGVKRFSFVAEPSGPSWRYLPLYDLAFILRSPLEFRPIQEKEFAELEYKSGDFCPSHERAVRPALSRAGRAIRPAHGGAVRPAHCGAAHDGAVRPAHDGAVRPAHDGAVRGGTKGLTEAALDRLLRGASDEVKKGAWLSYKEDRIVPGRPFVPLKPLRPAEPSARQTFDKFLDFVEWWPVWVSAKRDGVRHTIHKNHGKILIFSDDGSDNSEKMPSLCSRLESFGGDEWVIDCEIEYWRDGQHYPREAAAGAVHSGVGSEFLVANIFWVLHWGGRDLHKEPFREVWKIMEKLPYDTKSDGVLDASKGQINLIPHYRVSSKEALRKQALHIAYKPGVEGVVVKLDDGIYPLDGDPGYPPSEIKWHKSVPFVAVVLERVATKTKGVYNYIYGLLVEEEG